MCENRSHVRLCKRKIKKNYKENLESSATRDELK